MNKNRPLFSTLSWPNALMKAKFRDHSHLLQGVFMKSLNIVFALAFLTASSAFADPVQMKGQVRLDQGNIIAGGTTFMKRFGVDAAIYDSTDAAISGLKSELVYESGDCDAYGTNMCVTSGSFKFGTVDLFFYDNGTNLGAFSLKLDAVLKSSVEATSNSCSPSFGANESFDADLTIAKNRPTVEVSLPSQPIVDAQGKTTGYLLGRTIVVEVDKVFTRGVASMNGILSAKSVQTNELFIGIRAYPKGQDSNDPMELFSTVVRLTK